MGTDAATTAKRRGRPREFDPDQALDQAIALFWERGFEAASMSELVEATGLSKSSIYNTFGSKDDLFSAELERYLDSRVQMLGDVVVNGSAGLDDIVRFFEFLREEIDGPTGHLGCLAINSSTELGVRDVQMVEVSQTYRENIRSALGAALTRAAELGEIDRDDIGRDSAVLLGMVLSLAVIARSGASKAEISAQLDAAVELVRSWRLAS